MVLLTVTQTPGRLVTSMTSVSSSSRPPQSRGRFWCYDGRRLPGRPRCGQRRRRSVGRHGRSTNTWRRSAAGDKSKWPLWPPWSRPGRVQPCHQVPVLSLHTVTHTLEKKRVVRTCSVSPPAVHQPVTTSLWWEWSSLSNTLRGRAATWWRRDGWCTTPARTHWYLSVWNCLELSRTVGPFCCFVCVLCLSPMSQESVCPST